MPSITLRELPHDLRLLRIAKVQAVGRTHRSRAGAGYIARGFGDSVHGSELRIEIAPAAIAIERHGQAALAALYADYARIARAWAFDGIGLHHVVVLLPNPAFAANIRAGQQALQIAGEIACGG